MKQIKKYWWAGMGAALSLSAAVTGCGNHLEPVKPPAAESGQTGSETNGLPQTETAVPAASAALETPTVTETAPSFTAAEETVYVTGDQVNLRSEPGTGSEVQARLPKGTALKRTGVGEGWSRVVYENREGYVSSKYISASPPETEASKPSVLSGREVTLNPDWKYAEFSKIHSGAALLYQTESADPKGITVCVNAGHGTKGGSSVKTQCHPDGTPKVTGGTTGTGAASAVAVSSGMQFADGTPEAKVTLAMAKKLKEKLLAAGYNVLMIRETEDVQLDNVARTVIANNAADCHIALHWDSTSSNKGAFYMSVPDNAAYRGMEPVKSNWEKHQALGGSLIRGLKAAGVKIFSNGSMEMDLTQTSYSTIPSVDIELGDKISDHSDATLNTLADGLLAGINSYFQSTASATDGHM